MTVPRPTGSTPIDEFLAGAGASSGGERWETIGSGLGLAGALLAVGVLVVLAFVHRGRVSEIRTLLLVAMSGGALLLVGGVVEIAGTAQVLGIGWLDALTDGSASSAMLRLLGGLLVLVGLGDETALTHPSGDGIDPLDDAPGEHRWVPGASSSFGLVGVVLGALSFAFDGHTVSEGPRVLHAGVNVVHVLSGGVWFGGIVAVVVVGLARRRNAGSIGPLLVCFSSWATVALVAVAAAGVGMAAMILDDVGDLTSTDWGRRLLVKTSIVGAAGLFGAYHHFVVVPRLAAGDSAIERSARLTVSVEAGLVALVVVLTTLLGHASITGG